MRRGTNLLGTAATALCSLLAASGGPDADRTPQQAAPPSSWTPVAGEPLRQPRELRSRDGVLKVELDARRHVVDVAGAPIEAQPFNGSPRRADAARQARRPARGDVPQRDERGHEHPLPRAARDARPAIPDNVFRNFARRARRSRSCSCRRDHSPGTYWYHVHLHGLTEEQVMGGMSGLLDRRGARGRAAAARSAASASARSRSATSRRDGARSSWTRADRPDEPSTWLVNGQFRPSFSLRPGETQLWRIANIGADLFYDVALDGHRMTVVAEDGSPVWKVDGRRATWCSRPASASTCSSRAASRAPTAPITLLRRGLRAAARQAARDGDGARRSRRRGVALAERLDTTAHADRRRAGRAQAHVHVLASARAATFTALINGKAFDPHGDRRDAAARHGRRSGRSATTRPRTTRSTSTSTTSR